MTHCRTSIHFNINQLSIIAVMTIAAMAMTLPAFAAGTGDHHDADSGHGAGMGGHRHAKWQAPPPEYATKRSARWADLAAIGRGRSLYEQQCQSCHGADGKGTGPLAASLPHAPADLTNHFHTRPGEGDAYLFWRVSEGGLVEPFKSAQSAMPGFKNNLSAEQRWDVLAYVHTYFHLGLAKWQPATVLKK